MFVLKDTAFKACELCLLWRTLHLSNYKNKTETNPQGKKNANWSHCSPHFKSLFFFIKVLAIGVDFLEAFNFWCIRNYIYWHTCVTSCPYQSSWTSPPSLPSLLEHGGERKCSGNPGKGGMLGGKVLVNAGNKSFRSLPLPSIKPPIYQSSGFIQDHARVGLKD